MKIDKLCVESKREKRSSQLLLHSQNLHQIYDGRTCEDWSWILCSWFYPSFQSPSCWMLPWSRQLLQPTSASLFVLLILPQSIHLYWILIVFFEDWHTFLMVMNFYAVRISSFKICFLCEPKEPRPIIANQSHKRLHLYNVLQLETEYTKHDWMRLSLDLIWYSLSCSANIDHVIILLTIYAPMLGSTVLSSVLLLYNLFTQICIEFHKFLMPFTLLGQKLRSTKLTANIGIV